MSIPLVRVGVVNLVDVGAVVGISSLLEKTIPDLDETKPVWQTGLETFGQVYATTLLSLELRNLLSGVYLDDPTGGMAFSTLVFLLQPKLHKKLNYLKDQASLYVGSLMTPAQ